MRGSFEVRYKGEIDLRQSGKSGSLDPSVSLKKSRETIHRYSVWMDGNARRMIRFVSRRGFDALLHFPGPLESGSLVAVLNRIETIAFSLNESRRIPRSSPTSMGKSAGLNLDRSITGLGGNGPRIGLSGADLLLNTTPAPIGCSSVLLYPVQTHSELFVPCPGMSVLFEPLLLAQLNFNTQLLSFF